MKKIIMYDVMAVVLVFALGFIIGRYGRSAPNIDVAEGRITKSTVESTVESTSEEDVVSEEPQESKPEKTERIMTVTATAYCPCEKCCGKSDGITATGTKATAGRTIAVDPSFIPYGTKVIIDGHTYIAEDCGGGVKGNKIDIFFNTHKEALAFGKRQVTIIVNEGE